MRHAKSDWSKPPGVRDHDRPLNARGKRDAPRMGEFLRSQGLIPDQILCSSAVRAKATADAVAAVTGGRVDVVSDLYLADVNSWQAVLRKHAGPGLVLAIAHNPGIEEFVAHVTGHYERMPTAAIAWFENKAASVEFSIEQLNLQTIWRPKEIDSSP